MHLVDVARAEIEERTTRSFKERALRLAARRRSSPIRRRFRFALKFVPLVPPADAVAPARRHEGAGGDDGVGARFGRAREGALRRAGRRR